MAQVFSEKLEALENLDIYIKRTIMIKAVYLLLAIVIHVWFAPLPEIVVFVIFLMIAYAAAISFLVHKYVIDSPSITNTFFLLTLLDLLLITVIVSFLGIILYVVYPFYIILAFMTLPRKKAILLVTWITLLYLGLVFLQYFQIFKSIEFLPAQESTPQNITYVFAVFGLYLVTISSFSVRCYDFYKAITRRITSLKSTRSTLEKQKYVLEQKIRERSKKLKGQKEILEKMVKERKKALGKENKTIEEKIEELEGFRNVALGREIRVKELKKELAKLTKGRKNQIS
ncbi:hypothetical protein ACFL06_00425 [Patescibacteria group bacterium]